MGGGVGVGWGGGGVGGGCHRIDHTVPFYGTWRHYEVNMESNDNVFKCSVSTF